MGARVPTLGLERLVVLEYPWLAGDDVAGERLRQFARLLGALASICPFIDPIALGVVALPLRAPLRYYGSEEAVFDALVTTSASCLSNKVPTPLLGVGEGLFVARLAARSGTIIPEGESQRFLDPLDVEVLCPRELSTLLHRLGVHTLSSLRSLSKGDIAARFGKDALSYRRLASGEEGEPPGWRERGLLERCTQALGEDLGLLSYQGGLWGGIEAVDERASDAFATLQRREGVDAVRVATLVGGRGAVDQFSLSPFRPPRAGEARKTRGDPPAPWPGRVPPPAPLRVARRGEERVVELVGRDGRLLSVDARGLLSAPARALVLETGARVGVVAWSAPWPVEEGWWSPSPRRAARLQVLTEDGVGWLLRVERHRFLVEGVYD